MNDIDIARHEERFRHMESRIGTLDNKIDALAAETHDIKLLLAEGRGKLKGALMIIACGSSVVGAVSGLVAYFLKLG
jgi:hypothetical protein